MKGKMTVNIEVDYETMLGESNQGAVYMFTGAKTVKDMIQIHMDKLGEALADTLKDMPLVTYNLDGRLIEDVIEPVEDVAEPVQEPEMEVFDVEPEYPNNFIHELDQALEYVSLELGMPRKIKANRQLLSQLPENIATYKGFDVEPEGMEEPFMIVYETYDGSEIKFYSAIQ